MKKVLAIMGSERLRSNTAFLFRHVLDTYYREDLVQEVILKKLDFKRCISCYGCAKVPYCVVKDEMTKVYPAVEEYDEILFFTPIYFNSVSAISKAFIDRMQVYWSRKFLLKMEPLKAKKATVFLVGGAPHYENQ
ncbi:MAG: flavodoxin family protein, partial [Tissierellia bacterium]|nr:flavodoxin family protein [Tissierellia bacterium]